MKIVKWNLFQNKFRICNFICILLLNSNLNGQENTEIIIDLLNKQEWALAEKEIHKSIQIYPEKEWLYINQIWVYQNLHQYENAYNIGILALKKWPESIKIKEGLTRNLNVYAQEEITKKNYSKSIKLLNESISIIPKDLSYYLLGKSYRELNEFKKAISIFEEGNKKFPESKMFIESLPYTRYSYFKFILTSENQYNIKKEIEETFNYLDRSSNYKNNYYYGRIFSTGLSKLGDIEYFEKTYAKLMTIFKNDPDLLDNFGFEYYLIVRQKSIVSKDDKAKAISYRKKAIDLYEKNNPNRKELKNVSFPLKGKYYILSQFAGTGMTHNGFAKYCYDFIKVDGNKNFYDPKTKGKSNSDYYNFGQEIYAVDDGVVVDLVTNEPDNEPGGYASSANYITILHNGYSSFYAHLKQDSIQFKIDDRVKKGQIIGLAGNSGMSSESHLHFCLNDENWVSIPFLFKEGIIHQNNNFLKINRPYKEEEIIEFD
jgi:murein DD-endopeptidase MepM/ murein hydrolase activator NlpD